MIGRRVPVAHVRQSHCASRRVPRTGRGVAVDRLEDLGLAPVTSPGQILTVRLTGRPGRVGPRVRVDARTVRFVARVMPPRATLASWAFGACRLPQVQPQLLSCRVSSLTRTTRRPRVLDA